MSPGKTLLAQSCVIQDADTIVKKPDGRSHCQIVTVWQEGADALIEQYKALVSTLPKAANLEVMVVTKKELMRKFRVKEEAVETTFQINAICKNASRMLPETVVYIYIDECWVTVPKRFSPHMTDVRYKVISYIFFKLSFLRQTPMRWSGTSLSSRGASSTPGPSWTPGECSCPWQ